MLVSDRRQAAAAHHGRPRGRADGRGALFPQSFANDLPTATGARLAAAQRPIAFGALVEPSGVPAWRTLPSWYLLGTRDNVIAPALQLSMAQRAHSHIVKVPAAHLAMLSHPDGAADLILAAARPIH
jgi:pimeloyl-ACP methyl ester carboxylesterase